MQDLRRLVLAFILWSVAASAPAEDFTVATWNVKNFPSGIYGRRAEPEVEKRKINFAAAAINRINPDVLMLQEVRDFDTCSRLAALLGPADYHVAICSRFKDMAGIVTFQQVAILANRKAVSAFAEEWKPEGSVTPPRGFVFASFNIDEKLVAFYSAHLKSNRTSGSRELGHQMNVLKRELSAEQLVKHVEAAHVQIPFAGVVIGADMNTNRENPLFVSEKTLDALVAAGFKDSFTGMAANRRVTWPGKSGYPDATFDYVFHKGLRSRGEASIMASDVSDHHIVSHTFIDPQGL